MGMWRILRHFPRIWVSPNLEEMKEAKSSFKSGLVSFSCSASNVIYTLKDEATNPIIIRELMQQHLN